MRLSSIRDYFNKVKTVVTLKSEIKDEVEGYEENLKKKGGSTPITVIEDTWIVFGEKEFLVLANSFLSHELTTSEIGYLADGLLLSNQVEFKNEKVKESLEQLTDPEINGAITRDSVRDILQDLKG